MDEDDLWCDIFDLPYVVCCGLGRKGLEGWERGWVFELDG